MEYLRRHPDYRRDWLRRRRRPEAAARWGLRLLEDPALDARDAHPAWFPDHDAVVQLYPDADPPPNADAFEFWNVPGRKHLIHDGTRLVLVSRWPGCCVRLALAPGLEDGMAYLYAIRACATPCARYRAFAAELDTLAVVTGAAPAAAARSRPTPAALLELHTLQVLDATRGRVLARGGRRAVRRGCRRGRLAQGQRLARPRAAAGAPGRCADARRLPPPGTAFATVALGDVSRPLKNVLSKQPCFLESASIRPRGVAGLDGGTSHATRSLAACRRCRRCARAAPTLSDQRRSRRVPAAVAAHAGETARDRRRPEVPQFGRRVMYAVSDLDAWADQRSYEATSDPEYAERHAGDYRDGR